MSVGDRIKELRGKTTVAEFCRTFQIHRNTLPRYESNKRVPDSDFLASVCKKYSVHADWLLLGEVPKHREEEQKHKPALDVKLLTDAVDTLEKALQAADRIMSPENKAEIVAKIYELYVEENKGTDKEKLSNILELIANHD